MKKNPKTTGTLADKIANILVAAPVNEDPEDGTDETKAIVEEEVEDANSDEEQLLSKFRKQNIELLADVDERYAGKKGTRKDLVGSDEDSDDEPEESAVHSESSEQDDEDDSDIGSDEDSAQSEHSSLAEDDASGGSQDDEVETSFTPLKGTDMTSQIAKGLSVRNQLNIWENLLEMRIQLQKCLIAANKMPQPQNYQRMKKESGQEFTEKVVETKNSLSNALDKLLLFQQLALKTYPETKNLAHTKGDDKTDHDDDDEEIPSDTEGEEEAQDIDEEPQVKKRKLINYESEIDARHNKYKEYRNSVIQKWHDKTRIAAIKSNIHQHSIISHIEHTLSDKTKLIKRTQLKRSNYRIVGEESKQQSEENPSEVVVHVDEYNTEIFDDDDFYHQMLRELIEMKSADVTDPVQLGRQWIQLQNLRSKMKRKVDTRASKGRKIRYAVHSKLVNFMAPIDENLWTDEAKTELYSSLFGKNQPVIAS
ncbi:unnamed protein product [Acanthoscelides obtectus]|uniref:Protein AATF n=1 Tax=Acanthoscelides obtectus TaxID=200917 RepID=A0A9P0NSW7_ACAOB|nr:unnamed protein product [Acanthoscelides obtectus]CAK1658061.1 Protein AATF [Acanthoscelides obtectus]